jgi:hypothetical protein
VLHDPAADRLATALDALRLEGVTCVKGATRIEARLACGGGSATFTTVIA